MAVHCDAVQLSTMNHATYDHAPFLAQSGISSSFNNEFFVG